MRTQCRSLAALDVADTEKENQIGELAATHEKCESRCHIPDSCTHLACWLTEFNDVLIRCKELAVMDSEAEELQEGLECCARVLLQQLRLTTHKTKAQDGRFADGEEAHPVDGI